MATDLFKIITIEYWLNSGTPSARRVRKGTPGALPVRKESKKWYAWIGGVRTPLSANKKAACIMLGERTKKAALRDAGAADPFEVHRRRPLTDHLNDYRRHLFS